LAGTVPTIFSEAFSLCVYLSSFRRRYLSLCIHLPSFRRRYLPHWIVLYYLYHYWLLLKGKERGELVPTGTCKSRNDKASDKIYFRRKETEII